MRKRYNTPHRSRVVKTRMTEEEYAEFAERLSACNMSQAEFIRQAITGAAIRPIITQQGNFYNVLFPDLCRITGGSNAVRCSS